MDGRFARRPKLDPNQQRRLLSGGLDQVWVRSEPPSSEERKLAREPVQISVSA